MTDIQFTDTAEIAGARITADGYLVGNARCARTGCQTYRAADLGLPGDGTVNVYRAEAVVFDKASLATFAGKPLTMGHPTEAVTAENWKQFAIGDVGTDIARDGEFVSVPYKIMDATAIVAVQGGTRQLSMGYSTGIEMRDGVAPDGTPYQAIQTGPIRINHLAIVPTARGGAQLRIGDAVHWGASPLPLNGKEIGMTDTTLKTVVLGDKAVQVSAADAHTIDAFKADAAKQMVDARTAHDKAIAAKDADLATKDAEITALTAKVLDTAALDKLVADRADLIGKVRSIADAIVTDGKSAADIKRAAVIAKSGAAMSDKSDAYIDAMFDIIAADAAKTADPAAKALADAKGNAALTDSAKIYAKRDADLSEAWRGNTNKKEAA